MAEATFSSSFELWIRSLLNELQSNTDADMSDFVEYLLGIVTSESETDEEKRVAIGELLSDLDLKVNFSTKENSTSYLFSLFQHDHPVEKLSQQILDRWNSNGERSTMSKTPKTSQIDDVDAINTALINAMNQFESTARQQKPNKPNDDVVSQKQKSQVLAKYSEVSDEEFGYEDEINGSATQNAGLFQNTNSQDIEDREKRARETAHEVSSSKD